MKFQGAITALVTPFLNDNIDEEGFAHNIHYQMAQGIDGILVLGSTGESSTLTSEEKNRVISIAVREANKRVPIWVGTGSYCTRKTIEDTKRAKDLGADGALIITPYYNKPTQEGIFRHFEACATNIDLPIIVYNNPARCATNIETSTLMKIIELPHIIGVKESSGNISQICDILHAISGKFPHFSVFSGDDVMTLPMMVLGAHGVISVVSNLVPDQIIALTKAALQSNFALAKDINHQLMPLYKAAFLETNPIPIKTAMKFCGMPSGDCRLPLYQMSLDHCKQLHQILINMRLIGQT